MSGLQRIYRNPLAYPAGIAPGFDPTHVAAGSGPSSSIVALSGGPFDILSKKLASSITGIPTNKIDGIMGNCIVGVRSTGTNNYFTCIPPWTSNFPTKLTYGGIFSVDSTASWGGPGHLSDGGGNAWGIIFNASSLYFWDRGNSATFFSTAMGINVPWFVAGSINRIGAGSPVNVVACRLDTGKTYYGSSTITTANQAVNNAYFGAPILSGGANPVNNTVAASCVTREVFLSVPQLLQWAADPWSFWYPRRRYNFVGAAAAGFNPYWTQQSNRVIGTGVY